jgi:hypothetical protein
MEDARSGNDMLNLRRCSTKILLLFSSLLEHTCYGNIVSYPCRNIVDKPGNTVSYIFQVVSSLPKDNFDVSSEDPFSKDG